MSKTLFTKLLEKYLEGNCRNYDSFKIKKFLSQLKHVNERENDLWHQMFLLSLWIAYPNFLSFLVRLPDLTDELKEFLKVVILHRNLCTLNFGNSLAEQKELIDQLYSIYPLLNDLWLDKFQIIFDIPYTVEMMNYIFETNGNELEMREKIAKILVWFNVI